MIEWLFWQVAGLGPMAGQNHHFSRYAPEKIPYAIERYVKETNRLYGVLNKRLADREFVAGAYSIADMAAYPWVVPHEAQGQNLADFAHLQRWFESVKGRPATVRAYELGARVNSAPITRRRKLRPTASSLNSDSRPGSAPLLPFGDPAIALMLINDPDRLHERMANGRSDEAEPPALEVLAHGIALRRRAARSLRGAAGGGAALCGR